ncbi:hypothetical protein BAE44_0002931 [Dichanthelium oligosanthes]|uniref:PIR2-like helical domain-containing protein n=1 Tax=Dichanthelium oligosanthes TaxID=888268 RepID=A0A1E5WF55_9POAL|nr:hypothetical protein BAE44_0002931 [Dichanthelium oligosanthes]
MQACIAAQTDWPRAPPSCPGSHEVHAPRQDPPILPEGTGQPGSLHQHELTERLHHSMLEVRNCYGRMDPVSNIIVNTFWHERAFRTRRGVKVVKQSMISTKCLWRAAARSLYGLVSFLCTRYPSLTPDQALQRLLVTGANLQDADPHLFGTPESDNKKLNCFCSLQIGLAKPDVTVPEAYAAAAIAAFHPNALAQKELLGSQDTVDNLKVASRVMRLQDGRLLSSEDLEFLRMHIFNCPSSSGIPHEQLEAEPRKVNMALFVHVSECRRMFWGQHKRASRMVAAALSKFNETAVGFFYS